MKLTYIANTTLPTKRAHGLQIMKTCEALADQGVEVVLFVPRRFRESKENPFRYYKVKENFLIKKIFCLDFGFFLQSLSFALAVFFRLLFVGSDLIYCRDRFSLWFLSFFRKNTVFEVHKTSRRFFAGSIRRAEKIIVITEGLKRELIGNGVNKEKILVAPDGFDPKDFQISESQKECRQKLNLSLDKKLVIYTGHLYPWKGAETLVLAGKLLADDTEIITVGGFENDIKRLKKLAREKGIKNVRFLGHRPYREIPCFLKAADCLVLTGTEKSEISKKFTSPMKMFEYMSSGKPIVASNLSSFREVLNEQVAFLAAPDNPSALAEKIKNVLGDEAEAVLKAQKAFEKVKNFSWERRAKRILDFLKT